MYTTERPLSQIALTFFGVGLAVRIIDRLLFEDDNGRKQLKSELGVLELALPSRRLLLLGGSTLLLGGAAALLLRKRGGVPGGSVTYARLRALPSGVGNYRAQIDSASSATGVPAWVIETFMRLESGGNPLSYNPEAGALKLDRKENWPRIVVAKYTSAPDYSSAVATLKALEGGMTPDEVAQRSRQNLPWDQRLWKFGSFGLMQVAAISAYDAGYPVSRPLIDLFEPTTNVLYGAKEIAQKARNKLVLAKIGHAPQSVEDWSVVRAAYVAGPGNLDRAPTTVAAIQDKFRSAARPV